MNSKIHTNTSDDDIDMHRPGTVKLKRLRKDFADVTAVNEVDLHIEPGEFLTLLGPSGCGKSTTLRMISGLETPTDGEVVISGNRVTELSANARDTSMVFQEWALFPHMTVEENISFGLEMDGVSEDERKSRIKESLQMVEMSGYESRQATELSGGQKQRVAMARAVVREPDVLLLDEPLASLDRKLRQHMQIQLKEIQEELGITFIYVTHDQEEALTMSDRIAVMNDGEIEQVGSGEDLYKSPETRFVATFIGETNVYEGKISDDGSTFRTKNGRFTISVPDQIDDIGQPAAVSVRPEEVIITQNKPNSDYDNEWKGVIKDTIYKGSLKIYEIDVNGKSIKVERQINEETVDFNVREEVTISYPPEACRVITN